MAAGNRGAGRRDEGHHPGGRLGNSPLSSHAGEQQTAASGVRQTDDLLPPLDADVGRHPRGAGDLNPP